MAKNFNFFKKPYKDKAIPLFWWSEIKFTFKEKENYGDLLSKYIVEKISGRKVIWIHPRKQPWYKIEKTNYLAAGSIIHHATRNSIVWGSGIIDRKQQVTRADFNAVRGPLTREYLLDLDYDCPEVYGDPALLLPRFYMPETTKKYRVGVIPHYHDLEIAQEFFRDNEEINVIDLMTNDVEEVTQEILSCEQTISSSLHGLIVSHAYEIPSLWVEFSDKLFGDGVKFHDYLESVKIEPYRPSFIDKSKDTREILELMKGVVLNPAGPRLEELKNGLIESCPFNKS